MKRLAVGLAVTMIFAPMMGEASSAPPPQIIDQRGDAPDLKAGALNADWADIYQLWLGTSRQGRKVNGINIRWRMGAEPTDSNRVNFYFIWSLANSPNCWLELYTNQNDGPSVSHSADAYYACDGDSVSSFLIGGLSVQRVDYNDGGQIEADYQVTVPLSSLNRGVSRGRYVKKAVIEGFSLDAKVPGQFSNDPGIHLGDIDRTCESPVGPCPIADFVIGT